jgi:hypothetical protein
MFKEAHVSKKRVFMIYDNDRCEIVVNYKTVSFNTSKSIFSTIESASKVCKQLNEGYEFPRFEIIQYRH